jgi:hypothetical protein
MWWLFPRGWSARGVSPLLIWKQSQDNSVATYTRFQRGLMKWCLIKLGEALPSSLWRLYRFPVATNELTFFLFVFFYTFVLPNGDVWGHFGRYWSDIKHRWQWYTSWICVMSDDKLVFHVELNANYLLCAQWQPNITAVQTNNRYSVSRCTFTPYLISLGLRTLHQCFSTDITRSTGGPWRQPLWYVTHRK